MSSNAVDLSAVWTVSFSCLLRCLKFSRRLFFPHIPHIPLAASGARASCSSQWSNRKQEIFLCRQKLSGRKEKVRNDQRWKCVISNKGLKIYLEDIAELSSSYFCGKSHLPRTASDHPSKTGLDNISMRGPKNPKQIKGLAFSRLSLFSACDRRKLHLRLLPLNCVVSNPICGRSYIPALAAILTFISHDSVLTLVLHSHAWQWGLRGVLWFGPIAGKQMVHWHFLELCHCVFQTNMKTPDRSSFSLL